MGVALATVYNWEAGKHEPRASQLRELAQPFGVTMEELRSPGSTHKTAPMPEHRDRWKRLTSSQEVGPPIVPRRQNTGKTPGEKVRIIRI